MLIVTRTQYVAARCRDRCYAPPSPRRRSSKALESSARVRRASAKLPWWERIDRARGARHWPAPSTSPSPAPPPSPRAGWGSSTAAPGRTRSVSTATTPCEHSSLAPVAQAGVRCSYAGRVAARRTARRGSSSPTPLPRLRGRPCCGSSTPPSSPRWPFPLCTSRCPARPCASRCCWSARTAVRIAAARSTAARWRGRSRLPVSPRSGSPPTSAATASPRPPWYCPPATSTDGSTSRVPSPRSRLRPSARSSRGCAAGGRRGRSPGRSPSSPCAPRPACAGANVLRVEPSPDDVDAPVQQVTVAAVDGRRWVVTVGAIACPGNRPVSCGAAALPVTALHASRVHRIA